MIVTSQWNQGALRRILSVNHKWHKYNYYDLCCLQPEFHVLHAEWIKRPVLVCAFISGTSFSSALPCETVHFESRVIKIFRRGGLSMYR